MPEVLKPKCGQTSEATGTGAASVQFLVRSAHQRRMCFDLWSTFDCIRPKRLFCPARTTPRASPYLALPLLTMAEEPKPQEAAAADAGAIHPLQ